MFGWQAGVSLSCARESRPPKQTYDLYISAVHSVSGDATLKGLIGSSPREGPVKNVTPERRLAPRRWATQDGCRNGNILVDVELGSADCSSDRKSINSIGIFCCTFPLPFLFYGDGECSCGHPFVEYICTVQYVVRVKLNILHGGGKEKKRGRLGIACA